MKKRKLIGLALLLAFALQVECRARGAAPRQPGNDEQEHPRAFSGIHGHGRPCYDEAADAEAWSAGRAAGPGAAATRSGYHMVRESSWYALGLLVRDERGRPAREPPTFSTPF